MILKTASIILLFLIAYGGFLITNAPAAWLVSRVNAQLASAHASLSNPQGGAGNGSGDLVVEGTPLGRLHWDASFWPLVTGHLEARIRLQGDKVEAHGRIDAGGKSLQLTDLQGRADLPTLARVADLPPEATGTLIADIQSLRLSNQGALEGAQGSVVIHGTRLPDFGVALGTLHLTLRNAGSNNTVHGSIGNDGGDLDITGQLNLYDGNRYTLSAFLKPHPGDKNDPMRDALSAVLGRPDGQGRYHYQVSGRLAP